MFYFYSLPIINYQFISLLVMILWILSIVYSVSKFKPMMLIEILIFQLTICSVKMFFKEFNNTYSQNNIYTIMNQIEIIITIIISLIHLIFVLNVKFIKFIINYIHVKIMILIDNVN